MTILFDGAPGIHPETTEAEYAKLPVAVSAIKGWEERVPRGRNSLAVETRPLHVLTAGR